MSIPPFDINQGNLAGNPVGRLPAGPPDGWPDGHDVDTSRLRFDAEPTFNSPRVRPTRHEV